VWCVAFVPLVGLFIVPTLAAVLDDIMMANLLFFGTVNTVFCCIDASNLKKAGYDTGKWVLWSLVLVPVYLYVRAKRLKDDYSYFIAWCVVFVIMTVLSVSV
jgi:O-antigen ligase